MNDNIIKALTWISAILLSLAWMVLGSFWIRKVKPRTGEVMAMVFHGENPVIAVTVTLLVLFFWPVAYYVLMVYGYIRDWTRR